jgi:ABC-type branched-subunit amino acid transport system substrate-binding protein
MNGETTGEDIMRMILAGIAALVAMNGVTAAEDLKIGFLGTFSGPLGAVGADMRDAAELALALFCVGGGEPPAFH